MVVPWGMPIYMLISRIQLDLNCWPGPFMTEMSGYQDWDCMVAGTLLPLIYWRETQWMHCGPTTITGADTHGSTELAKEESLQCNKERRVCTMSSEVHFASSELPTQRAPSVKSKVTVLPQARPSLFGQGSPVTALDQLSGSEEEVASQRASSCWVVCSHPRGLWPDLMWYPTDWME